MPFDPCKPDVWGIAAAMRTTQDLHSTGQGELPQEGGNRAGEGDKRLPQGGKRILPGLPPELAASLPQSRQRLGETALRTLMRDLCGWQARNQHESL